MGRRFAIVIGVAASGVMALGAQAYGGFADEKQKLGKAVKVNASCGDALEGRGPEDEACTARAKGKLLWFTPVSGSHETSSSRLARPDPPTNVTRNKLKPASADLGPGETTILSLKMTEKTRKKARKALAHGKRVLAQVTVRATDAAGNVARDGRTIRLIKHHPRG